MNHNIPTALRETPRWIQWDYEERGGKQTKPPIAVGGNGYASVTDPSTWGTFDQVADSEKKGFVLHESDNIVGIDIDKAVEEDGELAAWAQDIVDYFGSYTEWSPSRKGVHIYVYGTLPAPGKRAHLEVYNDKRYFTVTGESYHEIPLSIREVGDYLPAWFNSNFRKYDPHPITPAHEQPTVTREGLGFQGSDDALIQLATNGMGGELFEKLHNGGSEGYESASEADLAYISYLAFWAGPRPEVIDRLFRASPRMRDKWDRSVGGEETYGQRTIRIALAERTTYYVSALRDRHDEEERAGIQDESTGDVSFDYSEETQEEEKKEDPYPCPSHLFFEGVARIADVMQAQTWEVWLGWLCATAANAGRNLHVSYYNSVLYGCVYGLLLNDTGAGKSTCTNVCHALLRPDYRVRAGAQSGPALVPILANLTREKGGAITDIDEQPAILVLEEWTRLFKNSLIANSTLQDDLNDLHNRKHPWTISRSDRSVGKSDIVLEKPTLNICATSTPDLIQLHIRETELRSGFFNRYLVIPGTNRLDDWTFLPPIDQDDMAEDRTEQLKGEWSMPPKSHTLGLGQRVSRMYSPDAYERHQAWGGPFCRSIRRSRQPWAAATGRLHMYAHLIPLLYTWYLQREKIERDTVEAAITVCETSLRYVKELLETRSVVAATPTMESQAMIDTYIEGIVKKQPHVTVREVCRGIRNVPYGTVKDHIYKLVQHGLIDLQRDGRKECLTLIETQN